MNILTRTVIALTDEEQQTLRDAADILRDIAGALEDRGGNDTGYNIRHMACDLENFVEGALRLVGREVRLVLLSVGDPVCAGSPAVWFRP